MSPFTGRSVLDRARKLRSGRPQLRTAPSQTDVPEPGQVGRRIDTLEAELTLQAMQWQRREKQELLLEANPGGATATAQGETQARACRRDSGTRELDTLSEASETLQSSASTENERESPSSSPTVEDYVVQSPRQSPKAGVAAASPRIASRGWGAEGDGVRPVT